MITLNQHNQDRMKYYGLDKVAWTPSGVSCPVCALATSRKKGSTVEMQCQVGIVLNTHPPKQKVRCQECKTESYMII